MAKVAVKFSRPPGTAAATFRLAVDAGREAMLRHWHAAFVPKHFTPAANRLYGYQPRDKRYMIRKAKVMHTQDPLVFSGDSRAIATNPANFRIDRRSGNVTRGTFTGLPTYFYKFRKATVRWENGPGGKTVRVRGDQPNKAEELTRITNAEAAEMAEIGRRRIFDFIEHHRPPASGVA